MLSRHTEANSDAGEWPLTLQELPYRSNVDLLCQEKGRELEFTSKVVIPGIFAMQADGSLWSSLAS